MPIVRGCVVEGVAAVPPILLEQVFPHVVERVLESSDSSILQVHTYIHTHTHTHTASKRVARTPFFGKFYLMWSKECVKTTTML